MGHSFLLVEDHDLYRDGLRLALAELGDDVTVQEATSLAEALAALAGGARFDLVLLDLRLGDSAGLDTVTRLAEAAGPRSIPLFVLSGSDAGERTASLQALGVRGVLGKSAPTRQLMAAIDVVLGGGSYPPAEPATLPGGATANALTPRQRAVLALLAQGLPNKAIARRLGMAESTVRAHVSAVLRGLGARNRTEAANLARERGLID